MREVQFVYLLNSRANGNQWEKDFAFCDQNQKRETLINSHWVDENHEITTVFLSLQGFESNR